jgi:Protein of unknown function (DUF2934)
MVVAQNLGHADTRMVERHYGHLAPSYIWIAHGCVDGQAHQHWLEAEREILASATNALARNGIRQKKRRPPARAKTPKILKAAS